MNEQLDTISTYFDLVQAFNTEPAAYAAVLHPEVEQTEYPNLLYKTIQRRSFADILDNLRVGRELLRDPHFEVQRTFTAPDGTVVVEGLWQAVTTSDIGPLLRGQRLQGQLCLIFEFKDGKIYRQRRYPCYELV
ncbi:nuclear transport factor 2 family protein [Hymenobacter sp. HSC-4F20]|uniref:nuclear transport factor 2 family protein n=1 Tax=Hymenobacter sp. HSC-4F20 TaxID=2864135 RepID=UPI001C7392E0|nr:nuclear transport factor 2 family protein [Hymenobacter sp. HSC-4F20]MBX0291719.1 nuclear transport factor 2 family protein [Hymenobacter sp. HSC-4F20]